MIIDFELEQTIDHPLSSTFSFLSDFSHMPLWNYYIQSVVKISDGENSVGTIYEQKRPHDLYRYKIIELNAPYKVTVELQPPGPLLLYSFILAPDGNKTLVRYQWHLNLENYKLLKYFPSGKFKDWLLSFVQKIILTKTKPAVEQNFFKLKILLETGRVTLQDGRVSVI